MTPSGILSAAPNPPAAVYVNPAFTGPAGSDPDGSGPATAIGYDAFTTIQQGLDTVAPGGTVNVAAGKYAENLVISRSVVLVGAVSSTNASGNTILAGNGSGIGIDITTAAGVIIDRVTVQGYVTGLVAGSATTYLSLCDVTFTENQFGGAVNGVGSLQIAGGYGTHTVYVSPTAVAKAGENSLSYSKLGSLTVSGGTWLNNGTNDSGTVGLYVYLNDISTADTVWFNAGGIARDRAPFLLWYQADGGNFGGGVTLVLSDAPETIVVEAQNGVPGPWWPVMIYAEGGNDVFDVAVTANSNYANFTLDGGGGFNTVNIYDQPNPLSPYHPTGKLQTLADGTLEFDVTYPFSTTSHIHMQNVEQVQSNVSMSS